MGSVGPSVASQSCFSVRPAWKAYTREVCSVLPFFTVSKT